VNAVMKLRIEPADFARERRRYHEREARMWGAVEKGLGASAPGLSDADRRRMLRLLVRALPGSSHPAPPEVPAAILADDEPDEPVTD
jgi:hypothetical protein